VIIVALRLEKTGITRERRIQEGKNDQSNKMKWRRTSSEDEEQEE